MTDELVKRLRAAIDALDGLFEDAHTDDCKVIVALQEAGAEAADAIERLEAEDKRTLDMNKQLSNSLADCKHELAEARAEIERKDKLFDAIAHGDQEHRDWLKQAIKDHFVRRPVERPRGMGTTERLVKLVTEARNKLHAHNRPNLPGKLRLEVRDLLDKALAAPAPEPKGGLSQTQADGRYTPPEEYQDAGKEPAATSEADPHSFVPPWTLSRGCALCGQDYKADIHKAAQHREASDDT